MAHIENETGDLRATLDVMDESELMAQQIVQQGATHALETLVAHGCTEQTAQDMLASLRSNMLVIEAVARDKGFTRLFAETDDAPRVPHPVETFHEAILAIVGELMHGDPAADSPEGRLLVKLADAVEAYERVVYPMGTSGVKAHCHACGSDVLPGQDCRRKRGATPPPGCIASGVKGFEK